MAKISPELFKGTAWHYARYWPGYPVPFSAHLVEKFRLDGTGRLRIWAVARGGWQFRSPLA